MTGDLAAFVSARLDEDEAAAKAAAEGPGAKWDAGDGGEGREQDGILYDRDRAHVLGWLDFHKAAAFHAARHDPARVLREVAAGRAILALHEGEPTIHKGRPEPGDQLYCTSCGVDDGHYNVEWPCPTLRSFAAVWSDHPDYRQEWKP